MALVSNILSAKKKIWGSCFMLWKCSQMIFQVLCQVSHLDNSITIIYTVNTIDNKSSKRINSSAMAAVLNLLKFNLGFCGNKSCLRKNLQWICIIEPNCWCKADKEDYSWTSTRSLEEDFSKTILLHFKQITQNYLQICHKLPGKNWTWISSPHWHSNLKQSLLV